MRNFREAVKREMEKEGWEVHYSVYSPSDLICKHGNAIKMIRAKGNGHGHIYKNELSDLKKIQNWAGVHVLVAKVNGANEIIFIRIENILTHKGKENEHGY